MENPTLRRLWDCEIKILDELDRICKKHNIQYFLMWGTLIGAVRHKGFIPWDDDIDIAMPRKDYKLFLKVAPKELGEEFFLQTGLTDHNHPLHFAKIRLNNTIFSTGKDSNRLKHMGIFLDILPMDNTSRELSRYNKMRQSLAERIRKVIYCKVERIPCRRDVMWQLVPHPILVRLRDFLFEGKGDFYTSEGYVFECKDFYPVVKLEFEGRKYPAPREYDKILRSVYGDYMEIPPVDKRVAHMPEHICFNVREEQTKDCPERKMNK